MRTISFCSLKHATSLLLILLFIISGCAHTGKTSSPAVMEDQVVQNSKLAVSINMGQQNAGLSEDDTTDDDLFLLEDEEEIAPAVKDPLYKWNKAMFAFNDRFYFLLARPITKGYAGFVHEDLRTVINNFFLNISVPIRFVNSLLQFKMKSAGTELLRFGINSTIGVAGLRDVAKTEYGLKSSDEDLGQTLGKYQLGHGAYFILPLLGPSSIRDTVGLVGDLFLYPIGYIRPRFLSLGIYTYEEMNRLSFNPDDYEILKKAAFDPYISVRDAYFQNRKQKVEQ